jgi:hypothetical protein
MNSTSKSVEAAARAGLVMAVALALSSIACGDDKPAASTPKPDAAVDPDVALPFPPGGEIPAPPDGAIPPPITIDANYVPESECCSVELSIADPDGNEMTARLVGDQAPLDVTGGMPLTYSDGRWRATVCLPLHTLVKYRFYFGSKLVTPEIPPSPDGGAADADESDAGVSSRAHLVHHGVIRSGEEDAGDYPDAGAGAEDDGGDNKPPPGLAPDAEADAEISPDSGRRPGHRRCAHPQRRGLPLRRRRADHNRQRRRQLQRVHSRHQLQRRGRPHPRRRAQVAASVRA